MSGQSQEFGGTWTQEKLEILAAYLDTYTTALKNQSFTLWYVDAFAGSGAVAALDEQAERAFLARSPEIALNVTDKPFDRLLFVEKDPANAASLRARTTAGGHEARVTIEEGDANIRLPAFCDSMGRQDRAVVFLDPFATQVNWMTVESVARTRKCDLWVLFPASAIRRLLPRKGESRFGDALTRVFGDESWRELQQPSMQQPLGLFDEDVEIETESGIEGIARAYMARLQGSFAGVAPNPRVLRNSRNSPLYVFMFAAGNKAGSPVAVRIADHILSRL
jgi:three-Cys-motif partner protein